MRRRRIALAVLVAAVLVSGVAAAAVGVDEPATPEERLAAVRDFVEGAETVVFEGRQRVELLEDGASTTTRVEMSGSAELPGDAEVTFESDELRAEARFVDGELYVRNDDDPFARLDGVDGSVVRGGDVPAADLVGLPVDLGRLLDLARRPELVGDAELLVHLDGGAVFGPDDVTKQATMRVTVDGDHRPLRYELDFAGEELLGRYVVDRMDWDEPVDIEAPTADELDETPWADEQGIEAFGDDTAPVVQLGGVPEDWVLLAASLVPADETVEGCEQVAIEYGDPDEPEDEYLNLYVLPTDCADPEPPTGSVPFEAGGRSGWLLEDRGTVSAQFGDDETVIQVFTDLDAEDTAAVIATLVPFDPATLDAAEELPGVGGETTTS